MIDTKDMRLPIHTLGIGTSWLLLMIVLIWWGCGHMWREPRKKKRQSISSMHRGAPPKMKVDKLPYYLQTDKRWHKVKLGYTNETLAAVGCTLSCTAMAMARYGYTLNPKQLNQKLKKHKGFTQRGWLIWSGIHRVSKGRLRVVTPKHPTHRMILSQLAKKNPVIAKIKLNMWSVHWVLIVGKRGRDYLIKDPLDNKKRIRLLSEYRSDIYSIRWIEKIAGTSKS